MAKQVIIVTGCSGRVGMASIAKLNDPQYVIYGFDIIESKITQSNFTFMHVDLTSDESVQEAMESVRKKQGDNIASIIHLAAYYSFSGGSWDMYDKLTIQGTRRMLDAAQRFKTEQFVFSSTMLVHAPCKIGAKITEESPLIMNWNYPRSKVLTEELIHSDHGNIPYVVLRIAGCYDDDCHSIPIANEIQRIYEHQLEARLFPGNIQAGAPFLHLEDLANCISLCIQKRKGLPKETTLLIGEETRLSYDELQREISTCIDGKPIVTHRIPKTIAKCGAWLQNRLPGFKKGFIQPWMIDIADANYDLDITKAKTLLQWEPKHAIGKTIPIMIKKLLADPKKWYHDNGLTGPSS